MQRRYLVSSMVMRKVLPVRLEVSETCKGEELLRELSSIVDGAVEAVLSSLRSHLDSIIEAKVKESNLLFFIKLCNSRASIRLVNNLICSIR